MQGLEAIAANNGWAMAATGACIVITGLSVLSFIISQLHRIIEITEKKKKAEVAPPSSADAATEPVVEASQNVDLLSDLDETARICKPVSEQIGDSFELAQLYKAMESANLPHPHITVRQLRDAGQLVPAGEGLFTWKDN